MTLESRLTKIETSQAAALPGGFSTRDEMLATMRRQIEEDGRLLAEWRRDGRLPREEAVPEPVPSGDPETDKIRRQLAADNQLLNDFISPNAKDER
jgi:hypothetical protein